MGKFNGVGNAESFLENHGERIVISGISGSYPQSNHVKDFSEILYNKVNPVSTEGKLWKYNHPEVPQYVGTVPQITKFDAQFFGIYHRLASNMDAVSRKILEHTFQAIYDAGLNPQHLSGKNVGVFIGSSFSETEKLSFYVAGTRTAFSLVGCSKAMFANRISYWLNAKGPSMVVDEACCSSIAALEQAYQAMSRGDCEAAIVGGANITLHPQSMVHFGRIMQLCHDGKTKCFDENADGCAKSEAISVLFLQKAKDALRVYADVLHVKSIFLSLKGDSGAKFGFYRDPAIVEDFLVSFYDEVGIPPQLVEYVEAFGSAVPEVDKAELEVITEVFCKNRDNPLLVGSVMSNIGYTEAATGICAITKVLLGYQKGLLAANLHCSNPRKDVSALHDGRIRLVTEHQKFQRKLAAINSVSVTGCNAHVLLHGRYTPKDPSKYKTSIPYLITISARQDTAVQHILNDLKSRPIDPEELALLHNIHKMTISGHLGRGFSILDPDPEQKTICLAEASEYFDETRRPLWFVYSGMGSQWPKMGVQLMRIPIFAAAIEKCQKILEPKGIDVIHIITTPDNKIFDNILHSFVGIAAIQIGLTDIMRELGLVPDNIIGHSVGELGCAYADGCLTAEEMILSAYSRGLVSIQTPFIHGSMAAVGMGYEQIINMVPPEIEVACHNSLDSSTISGPSEIMREFVASLTAKGIFAKEVPCSNIAYHSRYIADAGPGLLKYLSEVIKEPKPRSDRWLSTSVPKDKWDEPAAKYSSAEYHTNNLLNSVLFEETSKLIPPNAVLVEIAPHGLLQAILKRSLPTCIHVPLTRRGHPDNPLMVLGAIGKYLRLYASANKKMAASCKFVVALHDDEHKYLRGSVIRGKNVFPFAAALVATWDTLAMSCNVPKKTLSVKFHDVHLFVQPMMSLQLPLKLNVAFHSGTGYFEIMEGDSKIATGFAFASSNKYNRSRNEAKSSKDEMVFSSQDLYQMLYEREYSYKGSFQNIQAANESFTEAYVEWNDNWVTLIDGLLQLNQLRQNHVAVSQPAMIRNLSIDVKEHSSAQISNINGKTTLKASVCDMYDYTRCGGVFIQGVKYENLPPLKSNQVTLKTQKFFPRFQSEIIDEKTAIHIFLQIVAENVNKNEVNVIEVKDNVEELRSIDVQSNDIPGLKVKYELVTKKGFEMENEDIKNIDLTIIANLSNKEKDFTSLLASDAFVLTYYKKSDAPSSRTSSMYRIVSSYETKDAYMSLVRWKPLPIPTSTRSVTVLSNTDLASLLSKRESLSPDEKLLVVTSYPPIDGMKELITQWRCSRRSHIYLVMLNHKITKDQNSIQLPDLDLAFNVLEHGLWGGVYYVPLAKQQPYGAHSNARLEMEPTGDLRSLHWVETPEPTGGFKIAVHYAALSTIDVKKARGLFKARKDMDCYAFGMDYSGVNESGEKVMGIVADGSCKKCVTAISELTWTVPKHWTLEEAATVPLPYALAFYCLVIKTNLAPNGSILVHGAAGSLGQAAISISLALGLEVFATVGEEGKKRFLLRMFPELKENHIGCSRDNTFGDMVKRVTNGVGVNCVLNCVSGELRNISLKCTNDCGVVIDTIQIPSNEDFSFRMNHLHPCRNYIAVDFSSIFATNNRREMKMLQLLISEGISRGYVRPLSRVTYSSLEAAPALRLLESSRHRGRVMLRVNEAQEPAHPRITCSPKQSHLIVCDDELYGLQLAERLVVRGARKLFIHLPKIPSTVITKNRSWEKQGVEAKLITTDLSVSKNIYSLLKGCTDVGPIEGIYFVSTVNAKANRDILYGLEVASRKLCTSLKYFAVISADRNFGNRTCISRARDRLPATKLTISPMKKIDDSDNESIFWRSALDIFESAVRSSDPVVYAKVRAERNQDLLETIKIISGIKIPENINGATVLKDLGVTYEKAPAIAVLLRDEYNILLSEENILSLSLEKIQEIEQYSNGTELRDIKGLNVFFSHIDSDELMATTGMVFMSTITNNAGMSDDEVDLNQTNLCIVPGMEGNYERFRDLCARIKIPAFVLQPGLDFPNETIQELADRYAKELLKRTRTSSEIPFYLLGYESGVMVALEIAAILEDHGLTGTVYCIGVAPNEFKKLLDEELKEYNTEIALQDAIVRHMFGLMLGSPCNVDLKDLPWREKVERCLRGLLGRAPISAQYARAHCDVAYGNILRVRAYHPAPRALRSRVILLRAKRNSTDENNLEPIPSSEIQQFSQQPVIVHELGVPLAHALKDLRCATYINQHLHPDLLKEFESKNLCESYLIDADMFMTMQSLSDDF